MPGNAFIKFTGIAIGESHQDGHHGDQGWIEIGDWGWDVEADTSFLKGGGSAVGKPQPGNLTFSHYYDIGSPIIMNRIVIGQTFPMVTIELLKQTGDLEGKPSVFFQLIATDVFITKVSTKGGEDGAVNQDVEMVFKEISIGYKPQLNTGKLDKTLVFNWSVTGMIDKVASSSNI